MVGRAGAIVPPVTYVTYDERQPYAQLPSCSEPPPDPINEAELSLLWQGQRFPGEALRTVDGRAVRVVYPGRRGAGPGPDFRDAVVFVGDEERRGDVELHVRASAFRGHGHNADAAYDGVALHVVYLADDGLETRLRSGRRAPVAALAPWVAGRADELRRWLEQPALWEEPCRSAEERLDDAAIDAALREAGEARFEARVAAMARQVGLLGAETAVWRALFDAIGVGGDRAAFRSLGEAFSPALARSLTEGLERRQAVSRLETALLGVAGLGEALPELPTALRSPPAAAGRPANRPERRIAGFAHLYGRAGGDFVAYALDGVRGASKAGELVDAWQAGDGSKRLLGPSRAQEIVLNVVLPFAAADAALREKALALAAALPAAPAYGKTAFLEANLRRADGKRRVRGALAQQGLLAFLGQWCSQGGCGRCPLS